MEQEHGKGRERKESGARIHSIYLFDFDFGSDLYVSMDVCVKSIRSSLPSCTSSVDMNVEPGGSWTTLIYPFLHSCTVGPPQDLICPNPARDSIAYMTPSKEMSHPVKEYTDFFIKTVSEAGQR